MADSQPFKLFILIYNLQAYIPPWNRKFYLIEIV